ncbi:unnamed protein product [marine sediment metagenome]|uniref:Uncharacterized protein n=1 Tax=marine sediment metagenome TaxID=412755 RepID=X1SJT5_9ZZZZ
MSKEKVESFDELLARHKRETEEENREWKEQEQRNQVERIAILNQETARLNALGREFEQDDEEEQRKHLKSLHLDFD